MKKTIAFLITGIFLSACYQDINLNKYKDDTLVVLNCLINSDTTMMADVSSTWFYTEHRQTESIGNLTIDIFINGDHKGAMDYKDGRYRSDILPLPGDTVRLSTSVSGKAITAIDRMPTKSRIKKVEIQHKKIVSDGSISVDPYGNVTQENYNDEFTYHITFDCSKQQIDNYYFVSIREASFRQVIGNMDYSYDPVFQMTSERINKSIPGNKIEGQFGLPFTTKEVSDDEYTLVIKETGAPFYYETDEDHARVITLYSISEAYYKYIISLLANDNTTTWQGKLADIGLVEPIKIYSNVQGGTGIVCCVTADSIHVNLPID